MAGSVGSEDGDVGFQIAPMVDVVFVLMLFFMACTGFQAKELVLETKLPSPGGKAEHVAIFLDVSADGSVFVNNQPIGTATDRQLAQLSAWLRNVRETFGDGDPLLIRPAPTVRHERIIQVLNATKAAGWQKVSFG